MDEHKANMITTWVENQAVEQQQKIEDENPPNGPSASDKQQSGFLALTQFKTCESDEVERAAIAQHQVQVHVEPEVVSKPEKRCPPPPPPRRTPPRDPISSTFSAVPDQQEKAQNFEEQSNHINALVDECNRMVQTLNNNNNVGNNNNNNEEEDIAHDIKNDSQEIEIPEPMAPLNSLEHPLRILSEENLTVVSSFGGSLNDITNGIVETEHDHCDPAKLNYFKVPDFNQVKDNMADQDNIISQRFKEFAQLEQNLAEQKRLEQEKENDRFFDDPRFSAEQKEVLLTFSRNVRGSHLRVNNFAPGPRQSSPKPKMGLTPQKQFQLLSQSLRHPDGSSNPELNIEQRSPGNGRSSSDLEEDSINHNNAANDSNDNVVSAPIKVVKDNDNKSRSESPAPKNNRFGFRFLKIFGSTRKLAGSKKSVSTERDASPNPQKDSEGNGEKVQELWGQEQVAQGFRQAFHH